MVTIGRVIPSRMNTGFSHINRFGSPPPCGKQLRRFQSLCGLGVEEQTEFAAANFVEQDRFQGTATLKTPERRKPTKQAALRARQEGEHRMAAGMTKTALIRHMAEKLGITNKQAAAGLDLLAETAIKETKKNGVFVIPGIGRLVKAERKARMGRNPQTGEAIKIKAKTVVKFRVAKAAKDVIAPPKK
jgi:DNA-binding protein HU-beta